jgi:Chaperone of endosialidase
MRVVIDGRSVCLLATFIVGTLSSARAQVTNDLVMNGVVECRLIDTRVTSLGDRPLAANETRGFNVFGSNLSSQGGSNTGCGIPGLTGDGAPNAVSIVVNIVAVKPQGLGNLQAWAGDIAKPAHPSVVNYQLLNPHLNIANEVIIGVRTTGTLGNGNDIEMAANSAGTEIVVDVVGYFSPSFRRTDLNATSPNLIAGFSGNGVAAGDIGATIGGGGESGSPNTVTASFGAVGGGLHNTASAEGATVPGGGANVAGGAFSFAAGLGSTVQPTDHGTFLFADDTLNGSGLAVPFSSAAPREFAVRASGGFRFRTSGDQSTGCNLPAGSGSFSCTSDRNAKTDFAAIDAKQLLDKLSALPIESWRYKTETSGVRHIGPMAQDFHAAFHVGETAKTIDIVDADGVALASIQALHEKLRNQDTMIAALENSLLANNRTTIAQRAEIVTLRHASMRQQRRIDDLTAAAATVRMLEARLQRLERRQVGAVPALASAKAGD